MHPLGGGIVVVPLTRQGSFLAHPQSFGSNEAVTPSHHFGALVLVEQDDCPQTFPPGGGIVPVMPPGIVFVTHVHALF